MARFAIVPVVALEDERVTHACLRVLCVLCTFTDKRGWCWPSLTTLAEKSRIARNDVTLHLKKLEGFGYIQRHENGFLVIYDFEPIPPAEILSAVASPSPQRIAVFGKTAGTCTYCGAPLELATFHMDHLIPKSRGGSGRRDNLAPSCGPCNVKKGAKTAQEFLS